MSTASARFSASRSKVVRRLALVGVAALALAASPGCSSDSASSERTLTVSAAASLTEAFTTIGKDFEADHKGVHVVFTFDSSGTLADQVIEGAPVDVLATADETTMGRVADADDLVGTPATFARNRLVIVTKPGNPDGVKTLADLAKLDVVSLCDVKAPCGALSDDVLGDAKVDLDEGAVTRGQNVKATLAAVTEGDADAALVYVTDADAAGDRVTSVALPATADATTSYPVAVVKGAPEAADAKAFVAFLQSDEAQKVLRGHGFAAPS